MERGNSSLLMLAAIAESGPKVVSGRALLTRLQLFHDFERARTHTHTRPHTLWLWRGAVRATSQCCPTAARGPAAFFARRLVIPYSLCNGAGGHSCPIMAFPAFKGRSLFLAGRTRVPELSFVRGQTRPASSALWERLLMRKADDYRTESNA